MIIKYDSFIDLENDFFKNQKIKSYSEVRFGIKYFLAESITVKVDEAKSIEKINAFIQNDSSDALLIESGDDEFNFILNSDAGPDQIFHALFFSIYFLNTISEKFKNINVYVGETFYKTYIDESLERLRYEQLKNYFKQYLIVLDIFNSFNFKIIKNGTFKINNAICAYVPSTLSEPYALSHEDVQLLKNKNNFNVDLKDKAFKKLYLRRSNLYKRTPANEEALSDYLNSIGFQSISLENLSIEDQIKVLENAELIVGFSGSCFSNLVFSKNKKFVVELVYTTKSTNYYEGDDVMFQNSNNKIREFMNRRYDFQWSNMINLFGHDVLRMDFHMVDSCEEIIEILSKDKHFKYICDMV